MSKTQNNYRIDYRNFIDGEVHMLIDELTLDEANAVYTTAKADGLRPFKPYIVN